MSLIFAPGKYLTWFSYFWTSFSLYVQILSTPPKSVLYLSTILHCFAVQWCCLRYWYFSFWISFLALTCSSECCMVCPTSITWQFLVFELLGDSCLEGSSIATSKSTLDGLLEKTLNGFIRNRCINFANYWRGIFSFIKFGFSWTELEWCGVGLKFPFRCWCS